MMAGQSVGGPFRGLALLAPRGRDYGSGPKAFQVNKTAASAGVDAAQTGPSWTLEVMGGTRELTLTRDELLELEQATHDLPIPCVEGWSTTQRWTGVPLALLARMTGAPDAGDLTVESLQQGGSFRDATLRAEQITDPRSLLALKVNGIDLSLDHGFPARVIVPAPCGFRRSSPDCCSRCSSRRSSSATGATATPRGWAARSTSGAGWRSPGRSSSSRACSTRRAAAARVPRSALD